MTPEERTNYLEVLHGFRFDNLPDEALLFLGKYFMSQSVDAKLGYVLEEANRLYGKLSCHLGIANYEEIIYPSTD